MDRAGDGAHFRIEQLDRHVGGASIFFQLCFPKIGPEEHVTRRDHKEGTSFNCCGRLTLRRSGARDTRPPYVENGCWGTGSARGSTRMPLPSTISHSCVIRSTGFALILPTVRPRRKESPSSIQFMRIMLSTSELMAKSPIIEFIPSISGFSRLYTADVGTRKPGDRNHSHRGLLEYEQVAV